MGAPSLGPRSSQRRRAGPGQVQTDTRSDEQAAVPALLAGLDLRA